MEGEETPQLPVFWRMKPHIVEYTSEWAVLFEKEKELLESTFSDKQFESSGCIFSHIEHFGSTSVPGMWAKPIIDIQAVAQPMPPSELTLATLQKLGYVHRPVEGTDTSQYIRFDKGDPIVTHCLHLRAVRSTYAITFRDYLRTHPEDVQRYSQAKKNIFEGNAEVTMKEYRQQKQDVLDYLDKQVRAWKPEEV